MHTAYARQQNVRECSNGLGLGVRACSNGLEINWPYVEKAIYANYNRKWAKRCLALMRRYGYILYSFDASELMILKPSKRVEAMKAISMLARVLGLRDRWKAIREAYGLKWSLEIDNVPQILASQAYSSLLSKARKILQSSGNYRDTLEFMALSGLRVGEALEAMRLYRRDKENYLNRELMVLEHFKYPEIFMRKSKKTYITVLDGYMLDLLDNAKPVTYDALRSSIRRRLGGGYCPSIFRKIWATYMRHQGLEPEAIDLLQGRTPKSIFLKHYYRPDLRLLIENVRKNLRHLRMELEIDKC
jgi:hypothetical protein